MQISQLNGNPLVMGGEALRDTYYPVGRIYFSTVNVSPASFMGGSWTRIQDRFLLCAGTAYAAGTTGGEATHGHEAEGYTRFIANPNDRMSVAIVKRQGVPNWVATYTNDNTGWYSVSNWTYDGYIPTDVDVDSANNMPPYEAVYAWKRVA